MSMVYRLPYETVRKELTDLVVAKNDSQRIINEFVMFELKMMNTNSDNCMNESELTQPEEKNVAFQLPPVHTVPPPRKARRQNIPSSESFKDAGPASFIVPRKISPSM